MPDDRKRGLPRILIEASVALTIVGGVGVLLRIAAVARGNVNLAFAIAHVSNFGEILLSTLVLVTPVLSLIVLVMIETWAVPRVYDWLRRPTFEGLGPALGALALTALAGAFAVAFQSSIYPLAIFVVVYAFAVIIWRSIPAWIEKANAKKPARTRPRPRPGSGPGAAILTGSLIIGAGFGAAGMFGWLMPNDVAWSSPEVLTFQDRDPFVGRVIAADEVWTYIIVDDPREMRVVPSREVATRELCNFGTQQEIQDQIWVANYFAPVYVVTAHCDELLKYEEDNWAPQPEPSPTPSPTP